MKQQPATATIIRATGPNAGIGAWYRRRLDAEIQAMQKSVAYWLLAAYRKREAEIVGDAVFTGAADASPAREILARFDKEMRRWKKRWVWLAGWLARRLVEKTEQADASALEQAYKAAGFTVKFDAGRSLNATTQALIEANAHLIKTIPQRYFDEVREIVTRGVSMGRDLNYISEELGKRYKLTRERARFIARDQADKASMAIQITRDQELGIEEGVWMHVPGKKSSRPTHEAMNGKRFDLRVGLYDAAVGRYVLPAELPNCRCIYRRILPPIGNGKIRPDGNAP